MVVSREGWWGWGLCIRRACAAALFLGVISPATALESAADDRAKAVGGRFAAEDGATAELYCDQTSSQSLLTVREAGGSPIVLFLEGDARTMRPVSMETEARYNDQPLSIVAKGGAMAGTVTVDGKAVQFYRDDAGALHTYLDGKVASDDAASTRDELSLMTDDYAQAWDVIRRSRVSIEPEVIRLTPSEAAIGAKSFSRTADLSDDEAGAMQTRMTSHAKELSRVAQMGARASRGEDLK
jgi:hypothetical protein